MKAKKRAIKWIFKSAAITTVIIIILSVIVFVYIQQFSKKYIYTEVQRIPKSRTALVLGAGVYRGGRLSPILYDRVLTAIMLFKKGRINRFLLSGDHGTAYYDEVNTMRKFLLKKGIPGDKIFMDHAGFDTYSSIIRAQKIFMVKNMIIVTQRFHLPRAIYIARKTGMRAIGCQADRRKYINIRSYRFREYFATFKAFLDVLFMRRPKYMGKRIPITGNGRASWD